MRAQANIIAAIMVISIVVSAAVAAYTFVSSIMADTTGNLNHAATLAIISPISSYTAYCALPNLCKVIFSEKPNKPISAYCRMGDNAVAGTVYMSSDGTVYIYFPTLITKCSSVRIIARNGVVEFIPNILADNIESLKDVMSTDPDLAVSYLGRNSIQLILDANSGWYRTAEKKVECDTNFQLIFTHLSLSDNTPSAGVWLSSESGGSIVYPPYISQYFSTGFSGYLGVATDVWGDTHVVVFAVYPSSDSSPAVATYSDTFISCSNRFTTITGTELNCPCPVVSHSAVGTPELNTIYCSSDCTASTLSEGTELNISKSSLGALISIPVHLLPGSWYSFSADVNVVVGRVLVSGYVETNIGSIGLVPVFSWCSTPVAPFSGRLHCHFYYPPTYPEVNRIYVVFEPYPYSEYSVFNLQSLSISLNGLR